MKQFDHMIERKLNLELSNVFPRLSNVFPRLKFLAGCGQFSDFSNNIILKPKQVICLEKLFFGSDVLAVLPTGYGKSLIYHIGKKHGQMPLHPG